MTITNYDDIVASAYSDTVYNTPFVFNPISSTAYGNQMALDYALDTTQDLTGIIHDGASSPFMQSSLKYPGAGGINLLGAECYGEHGVLVDLLWTCRIYAATGATVGTYWDITMPALTRYADGVGVFPFVLVRYKLGGFSGGSGWYLSGRDSASNTISGTGIPIDDYSGDVTGAHLMYGYNYFSRLPNGPNAATEGWKSITRVTHQGAAGTVNQFYLTVGLCKPLMLLGGRRSFTEAASMMLPLAAGSDGSRPCLVVMRRPGSSTEMKLVTAAL